MNHTSNNRFFYLALASYCIITFLSLDMYLPALPRMAADMGLSHDAVQYTITIWFLGSASLQGFLGPIADYVGRKRVFLWGILLFIASSLLLATTRHYPLILLGRFIQGGTVCSTMVAGMATIHTIYKGREAVQIMAVLSTITILAPALGPLLGAFVLHAYGWQSIFFCLAMAATISFFVHSAVMPDTREAEASLKLRVVMQQYADILLRSPFIRFVAVNVLLTSVFFMWIVDSPFIIIEHMGKDAFYFGVVQIPIFSAFILGGQMTKYWAAHVAIDRLVLIGISIALGAAVMLLLGSWLQLSLPYLVGMMTLLAMGAAMTFGPLSRYAIVVSDAPTGSKVALSSAMTSIAGVISSALVGMMHSVSFFALAVPMVLASIAALGIFLCAEKPSLD